MLIVLAVGHVPYLNDCDNIKERMEAPIVIPSATPMMKSLGARKERLAGTRALLIIAQTVAFCSNKNSDIQTVGSVF